MAGEKLPSICKLIGTDCKKRVECLINSWIEVTLKTGGVVHGHSLCSMWICGVIHTEVPPKVVSG